MGGGGGFELLESFEGEFEGRFEKRFTPGRVARIAISGALLCGYGELNGINSSLTDGEEEECSSFLVFQLQTRGRNYFRYMDILRFGFVQSFTLLSTKEDRIIRTFAAKPILTKNFNT